tara:strand:- start:193 stop:459 length:267 start_codon:yes stop_codon:yes gene_type:complete
MNKILLLPFLLSLLSFAGIVYLIYKTKKLLVEDFQEKNSGELWMYLSKIHSDYQKNEILRGEITKEITEHYSEVEKYRMSKKIAKPIE